MIEARLIMNLDSQTKISLVLEEDETVVATEDFFQKLEDHTVLIAISDTGLSKGKNDLVLDQLTESLKSSIYIYLSYYQLNTFISTVDSFSVSFVTKDLKITALQIKILLVDKSDNQSARFVCFNSNVVNCNFQAKVMILTHLQSLLLMRRLIRMQTSLMMSRPVPQWLKKLS